MQSYFYKKEKKKRETLRLKRDQMYCRTTFFFTLQRRISDKLNLYYFNCYVRYVEFNSHYIWLELQRVVRRSVKGTESSRFHHTATPSRSETSPNDLHTHAHRRSIIRVRCTCRCNWPVTHGISTLSPARVIVNSCLSPATSKPTSVTVIPFLISPHRFSFPPVYTIFPATQFLENEDYLKIFPCQSLRFCKIRERNCSFPDNWGPRSPSKLIGENSKSSPATST